jgi:hypothetical protein
MPATRSAANASRGIRRLRTRTKKADEVEHPKVFHLAGLLMNELLDNAELLFI